jgi:hypothetical protein
VGIVLSRLIVTLAVAVSSAVSMAVPLTIWPTPSVDTVCGLGQLAIGRPPAVQVYVTVTFELFQPLPFAAGVADAEIAGGVTTVKPAPLLLAPATCTTMLPVEAPDGTGTTICPIFQAVGLPVTPLNVTVPPEPVPKPEPLIVIGNVTAPTDDERLVMLGATVNITPLETTPEAATTTLPVVAAAGTATTMLVALQLVGVAVVPLIVTAPVPWVAPKFVPVIVTEVPTTPEVGDKLLMFGAGSTVKLEPLLANAPTVTTTFPVVAPVGTVAKMLVAFQLVGVAVVPLNLIVLDPWVAPKFVPVIVTDAPIAPAVGDRLAMAGVTVNPSSATSLVRAFDEAKRIA